MITFKFYDPQTKCEQAWIDSSMIYYTKMVEFDTENKGDLYVTFKNGATYRYKSVEFSDYVLFIAGGLDGSQGKTLNKIIKPKYEVEKVDGPSIEELETALNQFLNKKQKIIEKISNKYCVSIFGYDDLSQSEFDQYYLPLIKSLTEQKNDDVNDYEINCDDMIFLIDCRKGCGQMAQDFLSQCANIPFENIFVVKSNSDLAEDCYINPNITNIIFPEALNLQNAISKYAFLVRNSAETIAFIRPSDLTNNVLINGLLEKYVMY